MTDNRLNFERVIPIFALTFVDILGLTIILPLLHLYAVRFGASPVEVGIVAASFPLAQLIGVPVMGALSDRYGRKPLLIISQMTTLIGFIVLALANSLWLVILSRVIDGLFGANIATAQAALSDITTDETRAQGLGLTGAAFGLGFVFGPVIAFGALEFSDNLALPALIAAAYSCLSLLLTIFVFQETLPPELRGKRSRKLNLAQMFRIPQINVLLLMMFAQQVIFFGFEAMLGLFTLSRLGLLGQGNAIIFIIVGVILVTVQVRLIGRWSRKYGEARLVTAALGLLALGLLLLAMTPEQPHPFYVRQITENQLHDLAPSGTEAMIGAITVNLPNDASRGVGGVLWVLAAIAPISIGAGLIRPSLNTLMTRRVGKADYGAVLGISASVVSAANAAAPILAGLIFQNYDPSAPFWLGAALMFILTLLSLRLTVPEHRLEAHLS